MEREEVWEFTPFIDLSLYRWVRRNLRQPRIDRQFLMLFIIVVMEIAREWVKRLYPNRLFALLTPSWGLRVLVWLSAPVVVGIALKVWNALRLEIKLEEQKRLLLEARLDALRRDMEVSSFLDTSTSKSGGCPAHWGLDAWVETEFNTAPWSAGSPRPSARGIGYPWPL